MPERPAKGSFFTLRCPHCGEQELAVALETLAVTCTSCGEAVTPAQIDALVSEWQRLQRWLTLAAGA